MNSPIKTAIVNKTESVYTITCIPRRRVVLRPKEECIIEGDVFSQCINTRSVFTLIEQMTAGYIDIYFIIDEAFKAKVGGRTLVLTADLAEKLYGPSKADKTTEPSDGVDNERHDEAKQTTTTEPNKAEVTANASDKLADSKVDEQPLSENNEDKEDIRLEELKITEAKPKSEDKKETASKPQSKPVKKVQVK